MTKFELSIVENGSEDMVSDILKRNNVRVVFQCENELVAYFDCRCQSSDQFNAVIEELEKERIFYTT